MSQHEVFLYRCGQCFALVAVAQKPTERGPLGHELRWCNHCHSRRIAEPMRYDPATGRWFVETPDPDDTTTTT